MQMELHVFYLCIYTYRTRVILWILRWAKAITLTYWNNYIYFNDGYCLFRLCSSLRSNVFWAATVITNFFTAFPIVGDKIVTLLWGGFAVDNATLNRFFSLHYLLPFVLIGLSVLHIGILHQDGSNNSVRDIFINR